MYFLLSSAMYAAMVLLLHMIVRRARTHPETFAGDWLAMYTAIFFTGGFALTFGAMIAAANTAAPSFIVGTTIATATAVVIAGLVGMLMRRRAVLPASPIPG